MEIIDHTNLRSDLIMDKGMGKLKRLSFSNILKLKFIFILAMVENNHRHVSLPLQHMQKDLRLAINMADSLNHPMPLAAIANEAYKSSRRAGYSESDVSALFFRAKH
jgi:3-hydroxyisobutyrate dehydrogenase-like beta-hydroxyacid dehydrogenase